MILCDVTGSSSGVMTANTRTGPVRLARVASQYYMQHMLDIYTKVVSHGVPNFMDARIELPSNFNCTQWESIVVTPDDNLVIKFLKFGFPASYTGHIPIHTDGNHPSANLHSTHVTGYIRQEFQQCTMLGPFHAPPIYPWCQTNPLLTMPQKDSHLRQVIMDLSWPLPPRHSARVNRGIPRDSYLGQAKNMHLSSAQNMADLIRQVGKGVFL